MINGAHAIVYATNAKATRAFFRDVLELPWVDAGRGWLIFALPPGEIAAHPAGISSHELYLMCDEIHSTVAELKAKGVKFTMGVSEQPWGLLTRMKVPGGGEIGLYEPRHAMPPRKRAAPRRAATMRKTSGMRSKGLEKGL